MGNVRNSRKAAKGHGPHEKPKRKDHHAHADGKAHGHAGGLSPHEHETTRERFARRYGGQGFGAPESSADGTDGPVDNGPPVLGDDAATTGGSAWHHGHPYLVVLIAAIVALAIVAIFTPTTGTREHTGPALAIAPTLTPRQVFDLSGFPAPTAYAVGLPCSDTEERLGDGQGRQWCEAYPATATPRPSDTPTATATPCNAGHVADCATESRFGQTCGIALQCATEGDGPTIGDAHVPHGLHCQEDQALALDGTGDNVVQCVNVDALGQHGTPNATATGTATP